MAVGKSSVGSLLAKRLSYVFFDTGMMYRAFTWKALIAGVSPGNERKLCHLATTTNFSFVVSQEGHITILVDGYDVSGELLSPKIENHVPLIAKVAEVRQAMVVEQRKLARRGNLVMAGRDIGTVVLPWAELKIFLSASTQERGKRRYKELLEQGKHVTPETVLADLKKRDEMDTHRITSPLKPAGDAIIINTENLSLKQVTDKIYMLALNK